MQYRYEIRHALANFALRGEELYSLRGNAQMHYRHEIEHALANFAPAGEGTVFIEGQRADAL